MSHLSMAIEKLCKFAFNFLNMDTLFIDSMSCRKLEYTYINVPEPFKPYYENAVNSLNLYDETHQYDVLFHTNSCRLNFISARIYDDSRYHGSIVVGPFLMEEPGILMIEAIAAENNMPISLKNIIKQYYLSLPLISTYKVKTIAEFLGYITYNYKSLCTQTSRIGSITYDFKTQYPVPLDKVKKSTESSIDSIEKRYNTENALLYAVEKGNKEILDKIVNEDFPLYMKIPDRFPNDPLRSRKNISFVLNTLLRKAAEKGGVHPVYIDTMSEKFAIEIEKAASIQHLLDLRTEMLFSYCDAVRNLSLKNFSPLIRKAMDYIRLNLSQELSLKSIASAVNTSPYTLSRQFKKNTGQSIIQYINEQRINESLYILENKNISITDTAYMVGFNDANYFIKIFRKFKGITPSEYRNNKK